MSEMEIRKGKLKLIESFNNQTYLNMIILEIVKSLGMECEYREYLNDFDIDEAFNEILYDIDSKDYMILNDRIYEIVEDIELDPCGFCEINKNSDGTISYITSWYNGGGSLSEVLENGLERLTLDEDTVN